MTNAEIELLRDAAALIRSGWWHGDPGGVLFRLYTALDAAEAAIRAAAREEGKL